MNDLIKFGKALSDPTRVRILLALQQSELCVCELVDALEISQSTLSTHLQSLRSLGIVATEKRQTWIIYNLDVSYRQAIDFVTETFDTDDPLLVRDKQRIESRIQLRIDGCCVVGSPTTKKDKEYIYVNN